MNILAVLTHSGLCAANGEARRMVCQGAVKVDSDLVKDPEYTFHDGTYTVSVGRNKSSRVRISNGRLLVFHTGKAVR
jgi:tyrosyl-tRNA synthetase